MRYLVFLFPVLIGILLSVFPGRPGVAWEHLVQQEGVSLLVVVPYFTRWRVNYRHWMPVALIVMLGLGLIIWSYWPLISVDVRPAIALVVQSAMTLIACWAYTQIDTERRLSM